MFKTNTSTHFTLAILRAVYLVTRMYLGLVVHFGRIATIIGFLLCFLTTAALSHALTALVVTVGHYLAVKLLDAGYRRVATSIAGQRNPTRPMRKSPLKNAPRRADNTLSPSRDVPLRLHSVSLSNFSHLHH